VAISVWPAEDAGSVVAGGEADYIYIYYIKESFLQTKYKYTQSYISYLQSQSLVAISVWPAEDAGAVVGLTTTI